MWGWWTSNRGNIALSFYRGLFCATTTTTALRHACGLWFVVDMLPRAFPFSSAKFRLSNQRNRWLKSVQIYICSKSVDLNSIGARARLLTVPLFLSVKVSTNKNVQFNRLAIFNFIERIASDFFVAMANQFTHFSGGHLWKYEQKNCIREIEWWIQRFFFVCRCVRSKSTEDYYVLTMGNSIINEVICSPPRTNWSVGIDRWFVSRHTTT